MEKIQMTKRFLNYEKEEIKIEKLIMNVQGEFCIYDIACQLVTNPKDKQEFFRVYTRASKVVKKLLAKEKLVFIGQQESNAPVKKKMYKCAK